MIIKSKDRVLAYLLLGISNVILYKIVGFEIMVCTSLGFLLADKFFFERKK